MLNSALAQASSCWKCRLFLLADVAGVDWPAGVCGQLEAAQFWAITVPTSVAGSTTVTRHMSAAPRSMVRLTRSDNNQPCLLQCVPITCRSKALRQQGFPGHML